MSLLSRATAALGAAVLLAVALPALPALAVPSTATLVTGVDVLPGAREATVRVRNADTALLGGASINSVLFTLPSAANVFTVSTTAAQAKAPAGWTVKASPTTGSLQTYQFTTSSNPIARGAQVDFVLPLDVRAPSSSDLTGSFRVSTSTDGGQTAEAATGALATRVRILELTTARVTAPEGVERDQEGTAGQAVTVTSAVRNYAKNAVTVTPGLVKQGTAADTVTELAPTSLVLQPGETKPFTAKVTLAPGAADRTSIFAAQATAAGPSNALDRPLDIKVQAPATLSLDGSTLAPSFIRTTGRDSGEAFTITGANGGSALLTTLNGTLDFAGNRVPLTARDLSKGTGKTFRFSQSSGLIGEEKAHGVAFALTATDANGFNYDPFTPSVAPVPTVTIDNTGIQVGSVLTAATGLTTVKDGDRLDLRVTVDDAAAVLKSAELVVHDGDADTTVPVTLSRSSDGLAYTGTATAAFGEVAETVRLRASFTDPAGNGSTGGLSAPLTIDNVLPAFTYAKTLSPTQILVRFEDFDNRTQKLTGEAREIAPQGQVAGGCTPSQWSIAGELAVRAVTNPDGSACRDGQPLVANELVLELFSAKDQDFSANVTYTPGSTALSDRARDVVANNADRDMVSSEIGVAPAVPSLVTLTRGSSTTAPGDDEKATFDVDDEIGRFYTRFDGNDAVLTFGGGRVNYRVQVLDEAGEEPGDVLVTKTIGDAAKDNTVQVPIPEGAGQQEYVRRVRLLNAGGIASEPLLIRLVHDTAPPAIASSVFTGPRTLEVTLNDKVLAGSGSDNAFDWFGFKEVANGRDFYPAARVSVSRQGFGRTLTLQEDLTALDGAFYYLQSANGTRYRDRAGNEFADSGSMS